MQDLRIFFSCPEDIRSENISNIIENIIEKENIIYLKQFGLRLELRHWKKNICLGKGSPRVQDRINNRLVKSCDIFLCILWTRFGSPPGITSESMIYSSGTEEEFYLAKALGKDIWIFFCDYPIRPSFIDLNQIGKVRDFKETLKKEQIEYAEFSSSKEFSQLLETNINEYLSEKYSISFIKGKEKESFQIKMIF
jgi:hypothetical protein